MNHQRCCQHQKICLTAWGKGDLTVFHFNISSVTFPPTKSFISLIYVFIYERVNTRPDIETTAQKIARKEEVRNARRETNQSLLHNSWHHINMTSSRYEFDALPSTQSFATLTIRKTTMVDVFLRFVTQSFVERMIAAIPTERWILSSVHSSQDIRYVHV